ncbi:MAG: ATP-binding protein [Bacteroidota bacterium]
MKNEKSLHILTFLAIVLPLLVIEYFSYREFERDLLNGVITERQSVASLSASILKERFDRVKEFGVSLSTRVMFRTQVREKRWEEAITVLRDVQKDFPFVERIFLADTLGTLMADYPALPDVKGENFAFRNWYKGVRRHWQPYLSEVYKRAASPTINVVTISCPIRVSPNGPVIGILVLQITLETLLDWIKTVPVGTGSVLYVVDHKGNVATHPSLNLQGEIPNIATRPIVQSALRGDQEVRILRDPESRQSLLSACAPVAGYGWGVIVEEPEDSAFASQYASLRTIGLIYLAVLIFTVFIAWLIVRFFIANQRAKAEIVFLNTNLQRRAQELESANKELEAFSYSVSHDLRAPLRHIDGFTRILEEQISATATEEQNRLLGIISSSAKKLGLLIDELLVFSRMARAEMRQQNVPMDRLIREVLELSMNEVHERGVNVSVDELPAVSGDETMLRQVWMNLISNALKYTGKTSSPQIQVRYALENGEHVFSVQDNGAGFDMRYSEKLFGVFQRLHTMDEFDGTGIGLAHVKRIITRHHGRVWARGTVGRGAEFYFTLPKEQPT